MVLILLAIGPGFARAGAAEPQSGAGSWLVEGRAPWEAGVRSGSTPGLPHPGGSPELPRIRLHPELPAPELRQPRDDARFGPNSHPPRFVWSSIQDAASYELELAVDPDFTVSTGPLPVDGTEYDLGVLVPADLWSALSVALWWRARGVDSSGVPGAWSSSRKLSKSLLHAPELQEPPFGARLGVEDPPAVLTWSAVPDAGAYELELGLDPDFTVSGVLPVTGGEPQLDLSDLLPRRTWRKLDALIWWRAAAVDDAGVSGPWSEPAWFSKSVLPPPENLTPNLDSQLPAREPAPTLRWDPVDEAVEYDLKFVLDQTAALPVFQLTVNSPAYSFDFVDPDTWEEAWGEVWWRVSAVDAAGVPGPWSTTARLAKNGRGRIACMGDSITYGDCYNEGPGYQGFLAQWLADEWGYTVVTINEGIPGAKSVDAKLRIDEVMQRDFPEIVLIMYGTNDSVDPYGCTYYGEPYGCLVYENISRGVEGALDGGALPFVATIPPTNPAGRFADNVRIDYNSDLIRQIATEYAIPLVEINGHLRSYPGYLPDLYCDDLHFTRDGFHYMAEAWFEAILQVF
jgi:lysophospholipase L1-like esterase